MKLEVYETVVKNATRELTAFLGREVVNEETIHQ